MSESEKPVPAHAACWTCGGYDSADCICGGTGHHATEVQNMREELLRLRGELPPAPAPPEALKRKLKERSDYIAESYWGMNPKAGDQIAYHIGSESFTVRQSLAQLIYSQLEPVFCPEPKAETSEERWRRIIAQEPDDYVPGPPDAQREERLKGVMRSLMACSCWDSHTSECLAGALHEKWLPVLSDFERAVREEARDETQDALAEDWVSLHKRAEDAEERARAAEKELAEHKSKCDDGWGLTYCCSCEVRWRAKDAEVSRLQARVAELYKALKHTNDRLIEAALREEPQR